MHWDKEGVQVVLETYGKERTAYVLANTIQRKPWDDRFSQANKEWAKEYEIAGMVELGFDSRNTFVVDSHPAVLDAFITDFRKELPPKEQVKQPSLKERLQAPVNTKTPNQNKDKKPKEVSR